jgi:hypothetical protein
MIDSSLMKQFLLWVDRESPFSTNTIDFETYIWKFAVYFRIGCGFTNWRFIFGHNVS